jgi:hypothetical protein
VTSFVGRHPVASYLVVAFAIFWASWMPVLLFGAPPRLFSAVGAILGLALPAFLVTAATEGRAGVHDLLRRTLRWRVGIGWYLLAILAIPVGALLLAPLFLGPAPLLGLLQNWSLLFTEFVPQLLLALVTVQLFEELGWAGLCSTDCNLATGAEGISPGCAGVRVPAPAHLPECSDLRRERPPRLVGDGDRDSVGNLFPHSDHLRVQPHALQRHHRRYHPRLLQQGI